MTIMKPKEILTPRLRLSAITPADQADLIAMMTDEEITKTYMVPRLTGKEEKNALYERFRKLSLADSRFVYGIHRDEKLIGVIHEVGVQNTEMELGYVIRTSEKNKGYASEALQACIDTLFSLGYTVIKAGAFRENKASLRVMEKCGMTKTGETEIIAYRNEQHICEYCEIRKESDWKSC